MRGWVVASLMLALILAPVGAVGLSVGQEGGQEKRTFRESVALESNGNVARLLAGAEDYLDNGEYQPAIDLLERISAEHGAALVEEPGSAGRTKLYRPAREAVRRLLVSMPPEGRTLYRAAFDPRADRWWAEWEETGSEAVLERIVRLAYLSGRGDDALWTLGERAWFRGQFATCRAYWEQLLPAGNDGAVSPDGVGPHYPDASISPADVLARLVLCDAFAGRRDEARRRLAELESAHGDAEGTLAGRTDRLATIVRDELEKNAGATWPRPSDVTTFATDARRRGTVERPFDVGSPAWAAPLEPPSFPRLSRPGPTADRYDLPFFPVTHGGRLYVQDARGIHARDLRTGGPAFGEEVGSLIYPPGSEEREPPPILPCVGLPRQTLTVASGALFALWGPPVMAPAPNEPRSLTNELICLGLEQGELRWRVASRDLDAQGPGWSFAGPPVVASGRAYAVLVRRQALLDVAVVCLDAATGAVRWLETACHGRVVLEANQNLLGQLLLTAGERELFLATGFGALLSIDADTGAVNWALSYESLGAGAGRSPVVTPPLYQDGSVYFLPNDRPRLYRLDAATGRVVWEQPVPEGSSHLAGLRSNRVVVGGRSVAAFDAATGRPRWRISQTEPEEFGYGQAMIASESVYWTSREHLYVAGVMSGQLERLQPLRAVDETRGGGNVVIAGDRLIVAQKGRLSAWSRYSERRAAKE